MHAGEIFETMDMGLIILDLKGRIVNVNNYAKGMLQLEEEQLLGLSIDQVLPGIDIKKALDVKACKKWYKLNIGKKSIIYKSHFFYSQGKTKGVAITLYDVMDFTGLVPEAHKEAELLDQIEKLNNFIKKLAQVFDYCFDEIYLTDGQGYTIFVSKACEEFYGVKVEQLIGKHVFELEKQGMFNRSVTREVLQKKKQVNMFQTTKKGKKLLVTANPIFADNGEIESVVTISRDITELSILHDKLAETEELMSMYRSEIEKLKKGQQVKQEIIAQSDQIKEILQMAERIAKVDSTVLIEGESGVGKGVFSSYIHNLSRRSGKPFITVNCGAIPENLLESELFGYESGAFTGARKGGKKGLFEIANGGTVFLDEITEIPLSLQIKLLEVIQEKRFRRVGGNKDITVDVRLIAATNQDIQKLVREGKFREDLFYRLNVVPLWIPPLRYRRDDISPLALHFLKKYNEEYRFKKELSSEALDVINKYEWPGNVRELENLIERLVVTTDSNVIEARHLPEYLFGSRGKHQQDVLVLNICSLKKAVEELESQLIKKAYDNCRNTYKMAEMLGVSQSTVVRKVQKYLGSMR